MKFDIKVKLNLDFLGDGWDQCYINYSPITIGDAKKFRSLSPDDPESLDKGIALLKDLFLDGKGLSGGKLVDFQAEDIEQLPLTVINKSIELMVGTMTDAEKKTQI
jgi:hypothetical protein